MPELFFADLVRETSMATGTGALALSGATPGHRRFADVVPVGRRFHYSVASVTHEEQWEVGEGGLADGALVGRSVLASSNGNALVDFSAGLKIVTLTVAADWFAARENRSGHGHAVADVAGLQAVLDGKQAAGSYALATHGHGMTDVAGLQAALDSKQAAGTYAASVHGHVLADIAGLQAALDGKQAVGNYAMASHGHGSISLDAGSADAPTLSFSGDPDTGGFAPAADCFALATGGVERARFTAEGRLGIGTSSPQGAVHVSWNDWRPDLNLASALVLSGTFGGGLVLRDGIASAGFWTAEAGFSLIVGVGVSGLVPALEIRQELLQPVFDTAMVLGSASRRWSQLYAATGTIATSDARDKHWIGGLGPQEMAAGGEIIAELGLFQWNAARDAKGADGARIHFGVRAQHAFDILSRHGLDWRRYGWCCHDRWEDEDGPHDRFGIRPDQLALFLIAVLAQQVTELTAAQGQVSDAGA